MIREINAETGLLGLIGNPVSHSLSPLMHNWVLKKIGLNYRYLAFQVEDDEVNTAIRGAQSLGCTGLNVTVPYKERVAKSLDDTDRPGKVTGAINTLLFTDEGEIKGYNTDVLGFVESLEIRNYEIRAKKCFVFGAGGAAKAVVYALSEEKADRIFLSNRTYSKAKKVARFARSSLGFSDIHPLPLETEIGDKIAESDLIINTTSVGMSPEIDQSIWEDESVFGSSQLVYDLVYNPPKTQFLKLAENQGAEIVSGLDMLIFQGLSSLRYWTGEEVIQPEIVNPLREVLTQHLR
mgnify:CR=1 FL=1